MTDTRTEHTPGPWKFEPGESAWVQSDAGDADICEMPVSYWEPCDFAEMYANGLLIAAAPDLLKAVVAAEDYFATLPADDAAHPLYLQMNAAIAKARGAA